TVAEAIDIVYDQVETAETAYYSPVVNEHRKVVGEISLRQLMTAKDSQRVEELMRPTHTALVTENAETVARRAARRGSFAVAVVDHEDRLLGIFTLDDAVRILEYEESEDVS